MVGWGTPRRQVFCRGVFQIRPRSDHDGRAVHRSHRPISGRTRTHQTGQAQGDLPGRSPAPRRQSLGRPRAAGLSRRKALHWLVYDRAFYTRFVEALNEYDDRLDERLVDLGWKGDAKAFQHFTRVRELETERYHEVLGYIADQRRNAEQRRQAEVRRAQGEREEQRLARKRAAYHTRRAATIGTPQYKERLAAKTPNLTPSLPGKGQGLGFSQQSAGNSLPIAGQHDANGRAMGAQSRGNDPPKASPNSGDTIAPAQPSMGSP